MAKKRNTITPAKSFFQAIIIPNKTTAGTARCFKIVKIVSHPLNSLKPSKENKNKKAVKKIAKILGLQYKILSFKFIQAE